MRTWFNTVLIGVIVLSGFSLSACGQMGPLELPGEQSNKIEPEQTVHQSDVETTADD